ncbi:flagellar assembly peptidoglycan hydrolase FlgJ [Uliginosibacterium paludis]|uniref:Peptidoglycan hydrolase FlgJ n=1 Tax=Uliginosibacterium paludis TaxID=1615952 RepID=A0ABV2CRS1_9RHOO
MNVQQPNALDPNSLADIKRLSRENSPEANKAVAKQFEAMFMQIVMKSMRDSVPDDGIFGSESTKFYQSLADQQLVMQMAQKGGLGLAEVIERQLNGSASARPPIYDLKGPPPAADNGARAVSQTSAAAAAPRLGAPYSASAQDFVSRAWPEASQAAASLGVPPHFLVAQAALETGWGKSIIRNADGSSSYNLFNIKAGAGWQGAVAEARTTEYENGQPVSKVERFRAYGSYAEAFEDYARLIGNAPRYAAVKGQQDAVGFARALQQGGYATDPAYADKLARIINGDTLRAGLLASAR